MAALKRGARTIGHAVFSVPIRIDDGGGTERANEGSLPLVAADLTPALQLRVRDSVKALLAKRTMLSDREGFIGSVLHGPPKPTPSSLCFYCLLTGEVVTEAIAAPPPASHFLVCLLIERLEQLDQNMELFANELNEFVVQHVEPILFSQQIDRTALATCMSSWFDQCIAYLGECMDAFKPVLPQLLHAAMLDRKPLVSACAQSARPAAVLRIDRVFRMLSIVKSGKEHTIAIDWVDGCPVVDCNDTNQFCIDWAASLLNGSYDSLRTRFEVERTKLKIVKQLNDIKRVVHSARTNNHDLYRAYHLLVKSKNMDVLLSTLLEDFNVDCHTKEVLDVIVDYAKNAGLLGALSGPQETSPPAKETIDAPPSAMAPLVPLSPAVDVPNSPAPAGGKLLDL